MDANCRAGCREQGFIGVANVAAVVPLEYPIAAVFRGLHANVMLPLTVTVPSMSVPVAAMREKVPRTIQAFFGSFGKVPETARLRLGPPRLQTIKLKSSEINGELLFFII